MIHSISQQLAQQIVDTIHDVCGYSINFINPQGKIYASSNLDRIGSYHEIGRQVALRGETIEVDNDNRFLGTYKGINIPVYYHKKIIAVVGISGEPKEVRRYAHLAERIANLLLHEQELNEKHRSDDEKKLYIIRSLQDANFDNQEYLHDCLEEFQISPGETYRMLIMEVHNRYNPMNISLLEQQVDNLFQTLPNALYAYTYPNKFVGLISDRSFYRNHTRLQSFSLKYADILKTAIGTAQEISQCYDSWQSAQTALSTIQGNKQAFVLFDDLTLEILLANLKERQRRDFCQKIFSSLNQEAIEFLKIYYEEDLSLQKTADRLFLHKNTVQQRLNRIQQLSGYNPRHFKDAVLLYLGILCDS